MSYIRAGSVMRYVDGVSKDYVYSDGREVVDYGNVSNDALIEMLGCYFLRRKYGRDDAFEKYIMRMFAKRCDVKLRERPLTPDELRVAEAKVCRKAQKAIQLMLGSEKGVVNKRLGRKQSMCQEQSPIHEGMSSVSINVGRHCVSSTSVTKQVLSKRIR